MNKRIKEVIVAVQYSKIVYADTNLNTFVQSLKIIEPSTPSKATIKKHLDQKGFYYFTNDFGVAYHICKYENSNYVRLKNEND